LNHDFYKIDKINKMKSR